MPERTTRIELTPEDCWALQDALLDIISEGVKEDIRINKPGLFKNLYRVVKIIATNAVCKEVSYLQGRGDKLSENLPIHPRFWDGKDRWDWEKTHPHLRFT